MADNTAVNSQITDAITQVNVKVLGDAPAIAMGNLFLAISQALGVAAENAVNAMQNETEVLNAAATQAINLLLTVDQATTQKAISAIANTLTE